VVDDRPFGELDGALPGRDIRRSRLEEEERFYKSQDESRRVEAWCWSSPLALGDGIAQLFGVVGVVAPNSDDLPVSGVLI
jgi:hypothetical protein